MPIEPRYEDLPEASHDAVHAARDHAQKIEMARQLQTTEAAEVAVQKVTEKMGDIMQERFEHVLAKGTEQEKSIILARVPFICQDIKGINKALESIVDMMEQVKKDLDDKDEKNEKKYVNHDQFSPVKTLAYGFAGAILTAFAGGLVYLVFAIPK